MERIINIDLGDLDHVITQNLGDTRARNLVKQLIDFGFTYDEIFLALDIIIEIAHESREILFDITRNAFENFSSKFNNN